MIKLNYHYILTLNEQMGQLIDLLTIQNNKQIICLLVLNTPIPLEIIFQKLI